MNNRVLFVDDDPNILSGFRRKFRKRYRVATAQNGSEGLEMIASHRSFAVIISDYRMPVMDGIQFLVRARELTPDAVRMMLTGYADLDAAIEAINSGHIFRFLTKPCPPERLQEAIDDGIKQYQLVVAERELLEETLNGCIKVLSEVLALLNPEAFGRTLRVAELARKLARELEIGESWQIETAARLCQIGCITLPEDTLRKIYQGKPLDPEEHQLFAMHPLVTADLLKKIPRMEQVSQIIAHQEALFQPGEDGGKAGQHESVPFESRILKAALDLDALRANGHSKREAVEIMRTRTGWYDPKVLAALDALVLKATTYRQARIRLSQLQPGMVIDDDIHTLKNQKLVKRGCQVTETFIQRLKSFAHTAGIQQPITVLVPVEARSNASPAIGDRSRTRRRTTRAPRRNRGEQDD